MTKLPEEVAEKLAAFCRATNKSMGYNTQNDEDMWHAFLIEAHKLQEVVDPDCIENFLKENGGWTEDIIFRLTSEYERAMSLLDYLNKHRI